MHPRRAIVGLACGSIVSGLALATVVWACVPGTRLRLDPPSARAGDAVSFTATGFRKPDPIVIRFGGLDGIVLGTFALSGGSASGSITIPEGTPRGTHLVVALQQGADGSLVALPVRASVTVTDGQPAGPTRAGPEAEARPTGLVEAGGGDASGLALVAGGFVGLVLFVAGIGALLAGRLRLATHRVRPSGERRETSGSGSHQ